MLKEDTVVPKQQQFYGKALKAERGVRQGDIVSPTIFNIVIDAVIRNAYKMLESLGDDDIIVQFYADDGILLVARIIKGCRKLWIKSQMISYHLD